MLNMPPILTSSPAKPSQALQDLRQEWPVGCVVRRKKPHETSGDLMSVAVVLGYARPEPTGDLWLLLSGQGRGYNLTDPDILMRVEVIT